MDDEALGRIFQPYFSTKATGTGLGLTIAKRNIELNRRHDRRQERARCGHDGDDHAASGHRPGRQRRLEPRSVPGRRIDRDRVRGLVLSGRSPRWRKRVTARPMNADTR